jgi:hypothetical protein
VIWVYARVVAAQVIEVHAAWNWPDEQQPHSAVRLDGASAVLASAGGSIAEPVETAEPHPAIATRVNAREDARRKGSGGFRNDKNERREFVLQY